MSEQSLRGSCLCGAVSYQDNSPLIRFGHCHYHRCCKATGSAHATNLYVGPRNFGLAATNSLDSPN